MEQSFIDEHTLLLLEGFGYIFSGEREKLINFTNKHEQELESYFSEIASIKQDEVDQFLQSLTDQGSDKLREYFAKFKNSLIILWIGLLLFKPISSTFLIGALLSLPILTLISFGLPASSINRSFIIKALLLLPMIAPFTPILGIIMGSIFFLSGLVAMNSVFMMVGLLLAFPVMAYMMAINGVKSADSSSLLEKTLLMGGLFATLLPFVYLYNTPIIIAGMLSAPLISVLSLACIASLEPQLAFLFCKELFSYCKESPILEKAVYDIRISRTFGFFKAHDDEERDNPSSRAGYSPAAPTSS